MRRTYRSWRRMVGGPLLGAVTGCVAFLRNGPGWLGWLVFVVFFVAMSWWPRVVTSETGVTIWNLRSWSTTWREIAKIEIAEQTDGPGLFKWLLTKPSIGLIVRTRDGRTKSAFALQSQSGFYRMGERNPAWLAQARNAIEHDRPSRN